MFVVWIEIECLSVGRGGEGIIEQIYRNIYICMYVYFSMPPIFSPLGLIIILVLPEMN